MKNPDQNETNWKRLLREIIRAIHPKRLVLCGIGSVLTWIIAGTLILYVQQEVPLFREIPTHVGNLLRAPFDLVEKIVRHPAEKPPSYVTGGILIGMLLVWMVPGASVCRLSAFSFSRNQSCSLKEAVSHGYRWKKASLFSFLLPVLGSLFFAIFILIPFSLLNIPVLDMIVMFLIPMVFIPAIIIVFIFLGLVAGFPLFLPAIAVEGTDSFDVFSRGFSYIISKPLAYGGYWIFVFGAGVLLFFPLWAACYYAVGYPGNDVIPIAGVFGGLTLFTSLFFSGSTAIYFLIRKKVDGTPTEQLFIEISESEMEQFLRKMDSDDLQSLIDQFTAEEQDLYLDLFMDGPKHEARKNEILDEINNNRNASERLETKRKQLKNYLVEQTRTLLMDQRLKQRKR